MRDSFLAILGLVIFSVPGLAANTPAPPPGGVAVAPNGGLMMSSQICATLAGAASGAEYRPGVNASGDAVAPADLPSTPSRPSVDNFPIEIDQHLARRFNLPPGGNAKAVLGYVTVRDNQAYFNGQPLNADQVSALSEACRAAPH